MLQNLILSLTDKNIEVKFTPDVDTKTIIVKLTDLKNPDKIPLRSEWVKITNDDFQDEKPICFAIERMAKLLGK